jgi:exosome complex RNA-binding protein Rrp42 (RNase PH superfamily)
MFKQSIETSATESLFLRQALLIGSRLDGRNLLDYRGVDISLSRSEISSSAEVIIGNTRVSCSVRGDITVPYPDRPTEGIIQINSEISVKAESCGVSNSELSRLLERAIKETDAIDTESLCIIGGEKVWMIAIEVRIFDYDGNIIDAAMLGCMSALRGFRKPEVTITSHRTKDSNNDSHKNMITDINNSLSTIKIHNSDECDPLPLALHHTPLSITFGIYKDTKIIIISDPSARENISMDGSLTFSINGHGELCAIHKTGEVSIPPYIIMKAANLAIIRAQTLHSMLSNSLTILDEEVDSQRAIRLEKMRQKYEIMTERNNDCNVTNIEEMQLGGGHHIDRNDPILAWDSLHQASVSI